MESSYEQCRHNIEKISIEYKDSNGKRNEATTRLHFIDTLFFECLNWQKKDVVSEDCHEREYTDYSFKIQNKCVLIVEAKKEGDYFELPAGSKRIVYKISSLIRDFQNLKDALLQVSKYCQSRGVKYGAIANGHQLITFIASRTDGLAPLDGKALVFSSLDIMKEHFLEFWKYLSKDGISENNLSHYLIGQKEIDIPKKMSFSIQKYPGIKNRNPFQMDLKIITDLVLEDIIRNPELETKFLEECYCKSNTISQYSLISKHLLETRYDVLLETDSPEITAVQAVDKKGITKEMFSDSLSRRPILLIGYVGVGKSTFLRNLIQVEAAHIIKDSFSIYIDLGSKGTLANNFQEFIINEIREQLFKKYNVDIEDDKFVRGVYNLELSRFKSGIYSAYEQSNPALFQQEEIRFLGEKLNNKSEHLKKSLQHISKGRKKQIILFIDNADQREYEVQEKSFLVAQEFAEHWPLTVFVALRPETFHHSKKQGALSGYHAKAFTISPPRVDSVIKKRLTFALKIANGDIPIPPGILENTSIHLKKLNVIIRVFLHSLEYNNQLIEFIDNICFGNVRIALDLVTGFFGSGHVDTEKILRIYNKSSKYLIPLHEFQRAVIYGDAVYYDPEQSIIANLFDISCPDPREHFLLPLLIAFLYENQALSTHEGFIDIVDIYKYLQNLGYTPEQIEYSVSRGFKNKLFEASNQQDNTNINNDPISLRITAVGTYHILRLCHEFTYIDAVIVDTPILDQNSKECITDVQDISQRLIRAGYFVDYLSLQWGACENTTTIFNWATIATEINNKIKYISSKINQKKL